MQPLYTLSIFTENSPGVLHRITSVFTRRKVNIESLTVSETERKGISRFTIVVKVDEDLVQKIVGQINRIIEVRESYASANRDLLYKEIAFIKVATPSPRVRQEIEGVAHRYGAHMVHVSAEDMVLEKTGTEDDINSLYLLLEPFGIHEFVRSGRIAIYKQAE